jgi:hypothetical protein
VSAGDGVKPATGRQAQIDAGMCREILRRPWPFARCKAVNDHVDAAYRDKYRRNSAQYVDSVVTGDARSTTIRLMPR